MVDVQLVLTILIIVVGFYTAWNIGANDVANAMGTSVGSGALTLKQAVIIAGIFEFLGAYLVGANVSETVRKKMFDPELFQTLYNQDGAVLLACAMIAALMGLYLGWIAIVSDNLLVPIIAHALYDFWALTYLIEHRGRAIRRRLERADAPAGPTPS